MAKLEEEGERGRGNPYAMRKQLRSVPLPFALVRLNPFSVLFPFVYFTVVK